MAPREFTRRSGWPDAAPDDEPVTSAGGPGAFSAPVGTLLSGPPLVVEPLDAVVDVARAMRDAGTGAALVGSESPGIVTDRDLRSRVVAEGRAPDTPVREVMSHPVHTVDADAAIHEALIVMMDREIHHLPVTKDGRIVGVVTDKHLLRRQARGPLLLVERIKSLARVGALAGYAVELAATARAMLDEDVDVLRIARLIAVLNDTLTGELLRLAEGELGAAPCPYAWLALGSEGRMEQLLATDQDNAIAYAQDSAEAHTYFGALAARVVAGLVEAGFPPCPGGYMATRWRRPLAAWTETFEAWIARPDPQAVLEAEVFLDVRRAHGTLSLAPLEAVLTGGSAQPLFLAQLARAALRFPPPLRLFGRIRDEDGEIDVKRGGLAAIVLIGRLSGLAGGSLTRSTVERLREGSVAGALTGDTAEALADSFRFLMRLRLREQLRMLAAGTQPGNRVALSALSHLERRRLREALRTVAEAQKVVGARHGVSGE